MKNKGFTLIELIVTLILLAIVGGIIIFNISNNSKTYKDQEYEKYVSKIESAAATYVDLNKTITNELTDKKKNINISVSDLINSGLVVDDLINPYTNKELSQDDVVIITLDEKTGLIKYNYQSGDVQETKEKDGIFLSYSNVSSSLNELYESYGISNTTELNNYYKELKDYGDYRLKLYDSDSNFISKYDNYSLKVDKITPHDIDGDGEYVIHYSWVNNLGVRKVVNRKVSITPAKCTYELITKNVTVDGTYYSEYKKTYNFIDGALIKDIPNISLNGYNFLGLSINGKFIDKTQINKGKYKVVCNGKNADIVCEGSNCEMPSPSCNNGEKCIKDGIVVKQKEISVTLKTSAGNAAFDATSKAKTISYKTYYMNTTSEQKTIYNLNKSASYFGPNDYKCKINNVETTDVYLSGWNTTFTKKSTGGNQVVSIMYNNSKNNIVDGNITCEISMSPVDCTPDYVAGKTEALKSCDSIVNMFKGKKLSICSGKGNCGGQTYMVTWGYNGKKRFNYTINPKYFSEVNWNVGNSKYTYEYFVKSKNETYEIGQYDCGWNNKFTVALVDAVTGKDYKTGTGGSISIDANYANNLYIEARWFFKPNTEKRNCQAYAFTDTITATIR